MHAARLAGRAPRRGECTACGRPARRTCLHPALAPGPDRGAHVVGDLDAQRLEPLRQPQVEVGDVHQHRARRAARLRRARRASSITFKMRRSLGSTSTMPITEISCASWTTLHALRAPAGPAHAEEAQVRPRRLQRRHQLGGVLIARGLSGHHHHVHLAQQVGEARARVKCPPRDEPARSPRMRRLLELGRPAPAAARARLRLHGPGRRHHRRLRLADGAAAALPPHRRQRRAARARSASRPPLVARRGAARAAAGAAGDRRR